MTRVRNALMILGASFAFALPIKNGSAEPQPGKHYSVQNVHTEEMMDVRGGSTKLGAEIWAFPLNNTDAQIFRFLKADNSEEVVFEIRSDLSGHLVTLNRRLNVVSLDDRQPISFENIVQQERISGATPSPPHVTQFLGIPLPSWQRWELSEVAPDVYYIFDTFSPDRLALTQSGRRIEVQPFEGTDAQRWRIEAIDPPSIEGLQLDDFRWKPGLPFIVSASIEGELTWNRVTGPVERIRIRMRREDESGSSNFGVVAGDRTSFEFDWNGDGGRRKEHCFRVRAENDWRSGVPAEVCSTPSDAGSDGGDGGETTGVQNVRFINCHLDDKTLRLWSREPSGSPTDWEDHGTVTAGCTTKDIGLEDGRTVFFVGNDCDNLPPHQTSGSCHKITTQAILGDADGFERVEFTIP